MRFNEKFSHFVFWPEMKWTNFPLWFKAYYISAAFQKVFAKRFRLYGHHRYALFFLHLCPFSSPIRTDFHTSYDNLWSRTFELIVKPIFFFYRILVELQFWLLGWNIDILDRNPLRKRNTNYFHKLLKKNL